MSYKRDFKIVCLSYYNVILMIFWNYVFWLCLSYYDLLLMLFKMVCLSCYDIILINVIKHDVFELLWYNIDVVNKLVFEFFWYNINVI